MSNVINNTFQDQSRQPYGLSTENGISLAMWALLLPTYMFSKLWKYNW
jgi:hypothetical protein